MTNRLKVANTFCMQRPSAAHAHSLEQNHLSSDHIGPHTGCISTVSCNVKYCRDGRKENMKEGRRRFKFKKRDKYAKNISFNGAAT